MKRRLAGLAAWCLLPLAAGPLLAQTPYYGGFGPGFLNINADGTYGWGEIRSGDLGLKFYGPQFGGPYSFRIYVQHGRQEWGGDLVTFRMPGLRVDCEPLFPECRYKFRHDSLPLEATMEAFAPWIPGDSKMSSLPALFFDFQLRNPDATEKTVALAFMVPNPESDGGKPLLEQDGSVAGVVFHSQRAGGGTLCGMLRNDGKAATSCGTTFANGKLDGAAGSRIASSIVVPGKTTRHIVFIFAWDFPTYISGDGRQWPRRELGHYHNNFYRGAESIARDCRSRYPAIRAGVQGWCGRMREGSNLPPWMQRQILINTSHMAYNGLFFKNGRAAMKEGAGFDLVGTYDEQFFASICELIFLPEAEWGNLRIFADVPTPEGAIRHDLGSRCVTATSTSPDHGQPYGPHRPGFWNAGDNTPEWILDLYRDYLWTGNRAKMKALWPTVRRGCDYMLSGDKDDNGLYDDPKTYDCFVAIPESMYVNDLQRAAFQAAARMADILGERQLRDAYAARSRKMAKAIETFWNPKGFYAAGRSQPDNPMSTALLGEHSDDLLCMSRQLDEERVRRHLKYIGALGHNFKGKTFQVMEHAAPGDRIPGTIMSNAEGLRDYCALALWRGCTEEAMTVSKCFYEVIYEHLKREWGQPMLIDQNRRPVFGAYYQSVPAVWHLLLGLEGLAWDVPARKLWIRPNLPASFHGKLRAFLPGALAWGGLDYSRVEPDCDQKLVLVFDRPFDLKRLGVRNSGRATVAAIRGGKAVPCTLAVVDDREYEVRFAPPLRLDEVRVEIRVGGPL